MNPPGKFSQAKGCLALLSIHPTQKPVVVMTWCMEQAKVPEGATVLDPYMGSGTTAIACIRTGRRFIGIEIDPVHFATAVKRVRAELAQGVLPLFGAEPAGEQPHSADGAQDQAPAGSNA